MIGSRVTEVSLVIVSSLFTTSLASPTVQQYPNDQLVPYKPDVNITGTFDSYLLAGTLAGLGVLLGSMALYGVDLYVRTEANKKLEVDEYGAPIPPIIDLNRKSSPPDFGLTPDAYSLSPPVDTYNTPRRMMRSRQPFGLGLRRMAREAADDEDVDVADDKIDLDESTLTQSNNTTA